MVSRYDCPDFGYLGGATQRAQLSDRVFGASRAPANLELGLHQEMCYLPHYPTRLAFYCEFPAVTGGETFVMDMRRLTAALDPELRAEVEARGVLYTRNFRAPDVLIGHPLLDGIHKTWTDAFSTTDPDKAIADCEAIGLTSARWLDNGSLSVTYRASGFIDHPSTGDHLWFNQIATQTINQKGFGDAYPFFDQSGDHTRARRPLSATASPSPSGTSATRCTRPSIG